MLKTIGVFLLALAFGAVLVSWSAFADPDAFYHAKVALLLWQGGALSSFPWLDLTTLGASFADHHYLFHVFEAPFVYIFGLYDGARLTAILLFAGFFAAAYAIFRWFRIPQPWLWTVILALSSPLVVRLLLAKASPLALLLFMIGMAAAWKRRSLVVFFCALLFALSHGGFLILAACVVLLAIGDAIYRIVIEKRSVRSSVFTAPLLEIFAVGMGIAVGTFLHPNFPENLAFLWIQVVKIGLGTPFNHVILGSEWLPADGTWLLGGAAFWVIGLLVAVFGLLFAAKRPYDKEAARAVIAFALPAAALFALTIKSRRSIEYLIPALALWIPWLWRMVDLEMLKERFREAIPKRAQAFVLGALVLALGALAVNQLGNEYAGNFPLRYPDTVFQEAFAPISERAQPGDRVFHSDWDEFPVLFSLDDRLRYIAGLDPTFLYEASSTLSDAYRDVTWGSGSTSTDRIWAFREAVGARFIFIDKRDHANFLETVKSDSRYELLKETDEAASFQVK